MARPRKYGTEEERQQAHAESQRGYRRRKRAGTVAVDREAIEELQEAVEAAAAIGDPVARRVRTGTVDALLRNLGRHFRQRATAGEGAGRERGVTGQQVEV